MDDIPELARHSDGEVVLALPRDPMQRVEQRLGDAVGQPVHDLVDEINVAVKQLAGREAHRRRAPETAAVGVRNGGLLRGDADEPVRVIVKAERDGYAAHDGAVARRALRGFGEGAAPGLERLDAALDEFQGAAREHADAAAVRLHPSHPALRGVRGVEVALFGEGLGEQQGHRRVADAVGIRRADGCGSAQVLGGNPQLIAGHEPQERSPGARDQFGVEHRP